MSDTTPGPVPAQPTWPAQPEPAPAAWPAPTEPAPPAWPAAPEPAPAAWAAAPEPAPPAWATAPPPEPDFAPAVADARSENSVLTPTPTSTPTTAERPRLNALAVAALILAVLLSPLAALFGHIAAAQISRSTGRERGAVIAWISVGMGYLWLVSGVVLGFVVWQLLGL